VRKETETSSAQNNVIFLAHWLSLSAGINKSCYCKWNHDIRFSP
jgi:hypothetical protein